MKSKFAAIDYLELSIWLITAVLFGYHELIDFDLGWHLAGGLYILDQKTIPQADPFVIGGPFWWNYSWLCQIIFALCFKAFGFVGLQMLQVISVVLLSLVMFFSISALISVEDSRSMVPRFLRLAAFMFGLLLVFPVAYLRPQILSVMLFCVLLLLAQKKALRLVYLVPLTVIWANVHVYWPLVSMVVVFYDCNKGVLAKSFRKTAYGLLKASVLFLCGYISPYGWNNISGIFAYLFDHQAAYSLINEFQPLSTDAGISFWVFVLSLIPVVFVTRSIEKKQNTPLFALYVMFAVLALYRIKYLPLFGIISAFLYAQVIGPQLLKQLGAKWNPRAISASDERRQFHLAVIIGASFVFTCVYFSQYVPPLKSEHSELLNEVAQITASEQYRAGEYKVLTHFDNGGWTALGFYLSKEPDLPDSRFKIYIDGRTLVAGQEKLEEFNKLRTLSLDWCDILKKWKFDLAVLPKHSNLAVALSDKVACESLWSEITTSRHWSILKRT